MDVAGRHGRQTVVAFGDSITDGHGSTVDANNRYPDELAERIVAADRPLSVANAGINGNMLLNELLCSGEKAVTRFGRDVAGQPGVRTAIVLLGANDIFRSEVDFGRGLSPQISAAELIAGHRALIRAAHARGIRVVGGTIAPLMTPFFPEPVLTRAEAIRDEVNHWIRTSGEFDAVADFDQALADPANPDALNPAYDSGDGIHPNDAGYQAMAAAIDLGELCRSICVRRGGQG